jgi:hypothetical protein
LLSTVVEYFIRVNAQGQIINGDDIITQQYNFDQEGRHRQFWDYVRDKDWKSAASFVDKRAIGYFRNEMISRRFRIMNLLVELFDETSWLVLYNPMKFKPGVTKSALICDSTFVSPDHMEEEEAAYQQSPLPSTAPPVEITTSTEINSNQNNGVEEQRDPQPVQEVETEVVAGSPLESELPGDPMSDNNNNNDNIDNTYHVQDIYAGNKFRPTTTLRKLPYALFTESFNSRDFRKFVKTTTETEASRVLFAASNDMEVWKELGVGNLNPMLMRVIRRDIKKIPGFQGLEYDNVLKALSELIYPKLSESVFSLPFHWSHGIECIEALNVGSLLVKSGKYGPEVDDFTMRLPANFPEKAGQAKYALYPALSIYDSFLRKLKVSTIPTTYEEAREITFKERLNSWYHRMNKTEQKMFNIQMRKIIEQEVLFRRVESSTYLMQRRKTFHELPGLTRHYPNPHYHVPAVVPDTLDFQRVKNVKLSFADRLFGREVRRSNVVPSVGRKPTHQEMIDIQKRVFEQTLDPQLTFDDKQANFEADVLGNLIKNDAAALKVSKRGNLPNVEVLQNINFLFLF